MSDSEFYGKTFCHKILQLLLRRNSSKISEVNGEAYKEKIFCMSTISRRHGDFNKGCLSSRILRLADKKKVIDRLQTLNNVTNEKGKTKEGLSKKPSRKGGSREDQPNGLVRRPGK